MNAKTPAQSGNANGLGTAEAQLRLKEQGYNELRLAKRIHLEIIYVFSERE